MQIKERPILFSGEMVRAILEGRKTQTRRIINPQPKVERCAAMESALVRNCKYGAPKDRLWVRETFCFINTEPSGPGDCIYRADDNHGIEDISEATWKPSIYMPRWASRITLEITNVRVNQVKEITEQDARAEGYPVKPDPSTLTEAGMKLMGPRSWYSSLWERINGRESWALNPWVWVLEFKRL